MNSASRADSSNDANVSNTAAPSTVPLCGLIATK